MLIKLSTEDFVNMVQEAKFTNNFSNYFTLIITFTTLNPFVKVKKFNFRYINLLLLDTNWRDNVGIFSGINVSRHVLHKLYNYTEES